MLCKLAARNVKRQLGNYLIYFITVALTVSLIFAMSNVIFSEELQVFAERYRDLKSGIIAIMCIVSIIITFVFGYATSFMLRLRKREFGLYLTMGMTRKNILKLFVVETMIIGLLALLAGIILGLFVFQGLMAIVNGILERSFFLSAYSMSGVFFTIALVIVIFILSSLTSAIYLKKVSISDLIIGEKKVEKTVKYPLLWTILAGVFLISIAACCILFSMEIKKMLIERDAIGNVFLNILVLAISIVFFHFCLSKGLMGILIKSKRIRSRGTSIFVLRQLCSKISTNAILCGFLALLLSFAVVGANLSFSQKASEEELLSKSYPFDIRLALTQDYDSGISREQGEEIIRKYSAIENTQEYNSYTTDNNYLHSFTKWKGDTYAWLADTFLCESQFNMIREHIGLQPITLSGGFMIFGDMTANSYDFSSAKLDIGGKTYAYEGKEIFDYYLFYSYFFAVVPDEAITNLQIENQFVLYNLATQNFDAMSLVDELTYMRVHENGLQYSQSDYTIKAYGRMMSNANNSMFIVGALYIALIFLFLAFAILSLKTLTDISKDRERYDILYKIGASESTMSKALFLQISLYFIVPVLIPLLLSIPSGIIMFQIMNIAGLQQSANQALDISCFIFLIAAMIYALYLFATYLVAKRNILCKN